MPTPICRDHARQTPYNKGWKVHFDGLVRERRNSIASALESLISCTNLPICDYKASTWLQTPMTQYCYGHYDLPRGKSILSLKYENFKWNTAGTKNPNEKICR